MVHAAGALADAPVLDMGAEHVETVVRAKIAGALALDAATRRHPVRHFVLCASAAGVLGSARQANHAYCSTVLDALAEQRRADGLPAVSLDWGIWRELGSAAALGFDRQAEALGLGTIAPEQGVLAFAAALGARAAQLLVLPSVDWGRFTAHFAGAVPGLLREAPSPPHRRSRRRRWRRGWSPRCSASRTGRTRTRLCTRWASTA